MGSDVYLLVFDSESRVFVAERWLGRSGVVDAIRAQLGRDGDVHSLGFEAWADVSAEDAVVVSRARYAAGAGPDEVAVLAKRYPPGRFWWMFDRSY